MEHKKNTLLWLAGVNLWISSFTFGGGYVVVPMVKKYFVQQKNLFTEEELLEMAAISQSSPGAIAVNLCALAGYRCGGKAGLVISCISTLLPPLVILSLISFCYTRVISNDLILSVLKGMQAGVAALIVDYIVDMIKRIRQERSPLLSVLVWLSFGASFLTDLNVALILAGSCLICAGRMFLWKKHLR